MKAYKGFNEDMTCTPAPGVRFQYKEGETYHEDDAALCRRGFHACENPLDCFGYYHPHDSVYHEVEIDDVLDEREDDTKVCGKTIKIGAALDVAGICKAHFEYVKAHTTNKEQGKSYANLSAQSHSSLSAQSDSSLSAQSDSSLSAQSHSSLSAQSYSALSAQGFSSLSAQSFSSLSAQSYSSLSAQSFSSLSARSRSSLSARSHSSLSAQSYSALSAGANSVLAAINSKAKAGLGSLIALAVRKWRDDKYVITDFAAGIVDGEKIKADTWYTVKDGAFVEVEGDV